MEEYETKHTDTVSSKRLVPMKILVLGMSRTGTDSIRKALLHLGYNDTYHGYVAAIRNPQHCKLWLDALEGKFGSGTEPFARGDWDNLLRDCQAVCDIPAICFASELMQIYPDAKVILSKRDPDEWHASVKSALLANMYTPWASFVDKLAWLTRSPHRFTRPMFIKAFEYYFEGDFEKNGKRIYHEHYTMVRKVCQGRQLEYSVEEGWEPLCRFLNEDVPRIPFPRGNTKAETTLRIKAIVNTEVRRLVRLAVLFFALLHSVLVSLLFVALYRHLL